MESQYVIDIIFAVVCCVMFVAIVAGVAGRDD
jgi:hypothetical protein